MKEENPFIKYPRERLIVDALVEVKSRRMTEPEAVRQSLRQRYYEPLSMDYIEDLYIAANLLCKRYDWARQEARAVTLSLQKAKI